VFLNDRTLYPALSGVQTNLYKNFIEQSWGLLRHNGIASLLHPEGVFDDPQGGWFRSNYYVRLRGHYQFKNELMLFSDIGNRVAFSINVYGTKRRSIRFQAIFNLFDPNTIERCNTIFTGYEVPAIKTADGTWELAGHPQRILEINDQSLGLFSRLFEDEGVSTSQARLPQVHSQPLLKVLKKFAQAPQRLGDLKGQYLATEMFHEANAQRGGIITREESPSYQPKTADEWVISGPHFYVGNPLNKTPFTNVTSQRAYDDIDLTEIPEDYLPRAVYRPGDKEGNLDKFYAAIPEWPKPSKPARDKNGKWHAGFWPVSDHEVPAYETLLGEPLKRYGIDTSLPGAKTARKFGYFKVWQGDVLGAIDWIVNKSQRNSEEFSSKFPGVKLMQAELNEDLLSLPLPYTARSRVILRKMMQPANERTLISCFIQPGPTHIHGCTSFLFGSESLTKYVAAISSSILADFLVKVSGKNNVGFDIFSPLPIFDHERNVLIIKEYFKINSIGSNSLDRYLSAINVDVLVALGLGLKPNELIHIYTVQFSVMKAYEEADQYDIKGRRLPNTTRKDAGAKELREALKNHDGKSPITVSWSIDNGNQTVTKTFYPPFNHVDRIEDYKTAYRVFSERLGLNVNTGEVEHAGS
jgi:hypothetical protein